MKKVLCLMLFVCSSQVFANELICSLWYKGDAIEFVEKQSNQNDKFKHCTVSCFLSLRCPDVEVWNLGLAKELVDVVGPGNAEIADLKADMLGILLSHDVYTDKGCAKLCNQAFPAY